MLFCHGTLADTNHNQQEQHHFDEFQCLYGHHEEHLSYIWICSWGSCPYHRGKKKRQIKSPQLGSGLPYSSSYFIAILIATESPMAQQVRTAKEPYSPFKLWWKGKWHQLKSRLLAMCSRFISIFITVYGPTLWSGRPHHISRKHCARISKRTQFQHHKYLFNSNWVTVLSLSKLACPEDSDWNKECIFIVDRFYMVPTFIFSFMLFTFL